MGWNRDDALQYTRAVTGSGLAFFEQPVHADDIASMTAISAAATDFAIGADESIHSMDDIRHHHEHKAARGVSLKTIKLGGMRAVMNAGNLCDQLGMSVNVSCKTGESSLAGAAGLHIAAALPQINWGLTLSHQGLSDDITANPIRIEQGHVTVSDRPGLGIDVDEDRVRRYRRDVAARKVA
jgi:muconate cycloisomerase